MVFPILELYINELICNLLGLVSVTQHIFEIIHVSACNIVLSKYWFADLYVLINQGSKLTKCI